MTSKKLGTAGVPRLPSRGSGIKPNYLDVIDKINDLENKEKAGIPISDEFRRFLIELTLGYLTEKGLHENLIQTGLLSYKDEQNNIIEKQYFYSGIEIIEKGDILQFEELPTQNYMVYDVVVTEVTKNP